MRYYPVFLDVAGRPCLVVGGGAVAGRKAGVLLQSGARVTVVSPDVKQPLARWARQRRVRWVRRRFRPSDLAGTFLVVAATDDQVVNRQVFQAAQRRQSLVNVVDQPARCTFLVPSVLRCGPVAIGISTSGVSPALSKWLRRDLTARYGPWVARVAGRMRRWRAAVHRQAAGPAARKRRLETLLQQELRRAGVR